MLAGVASWAPAPGRTAGAARLISTTATTETRGKNRRMTSPPVTDDRPTASVAAGAASISLVIRSELRGFELARKCMARGGGARRCLQASRAAAGLGTALTGLRALGA